MKRDIIDFASVRPEHYEIHGRLENWARWCKGRGTAGSVSPMFRLYRSTARAREYATSANPVDSADATQMQKQVSALPSRHRIAVSWSYVRNGADPRTVAQQVGASKEGLADLVHDARQMLCNRGVAP